MPFHLPLGSIFWGKTIFPLIGRTRWATLLILAIAVLGTPPLQGQEGEVSLKSQGPVRPLKERLRTVKEFQIMARTLISERELTEIMHNFIFDRVKFNLGEIFAPHPSIIRAELPAMIIKKNGEFVAADKKGSVVLYYPGAGNDLHRPFVFADPDEVVIIDPDPWSVGIDEQGELIMNMEKVEDEQLKIDAYIRGYTRILLEEGATNLQATQVELTDHEIKNVMPYSPQERRRLIEDYRKMDMDEESATVEVDHYLNNRYFKRGMFGAQFDFDLRSKRRKMIFYPRMLGDEIFPHSPLIDGADVVMIRRTHGNTSPHLLFDRVLKERGIFMDFSPSFSFSYADRKDIKGPIWEGIFDHVEETSLSKATMVKKDKEGVFSKADNIFAFVDFQQGMVSVPDFPIKENLLRLESILKSAAEFRLNWALKWREQLRFYLKVFIAEELDKHLKAFTRLEKSLTAKERKDIAVKFRGVVKNIIRFIKILKIDYGMSLTAMDLAPIEGQLERASKILPLKLDKARATLKSMESSAPMTEDCTRKEKSPLGELQKWSDDLKGL